MVTQEFSRNKSVMLPTAVLGALLLGGFGSSAGPVSNTPIQSAMAYELNIPSVVQKYESWCIPASSEMSLYSIIGRSVGQTSLAEEMHTDDPVSGTRINAATDALNHYAHTLGYRYTQEFPTSPVVFGNELRYDLAHGWAPLVGVLYTERPWDKKSPLTIDGHEVVVKGLTNTGEAIVIDPEISTNGGGQHIVSVNELYDAMVVQSPGNQHGQMPLGVQLISPENP